MGTRELMGKAIAFIGVIHLGNAHGWLTPLAIMIMIWGNNMNLFVDKKRN